MHDGRARRRGESRPKQFRCGLIEPAAFPFCAQLNVLYEILRKIECGDDARKSAG
jgi:hypothetical protein